MTCKDCIHYNTCVIVEHRVDEDEDHLSEFGCENFINKNDVMEVVRGEWIDNHCSICGMTPLGEEFWEHLDLEPPKFEYYMNYCPECGIKMDKKKMEYKNYILKDKTK